jgi:hypothetical protein
LSDTHYEAIDEGGTPKSTNTRKRFGSRTRRRTMW